MFQKLLERVSGELAKAGVPYMIIGGQAVLLYGEPRLTRDIDVTLGVGMEGLKTIQRIASNLHLKTLVKNPEKFAGETMVLPVADQKSGIRIDFIFSFTPYERQAIAGARLVKLGKSAVRFASLEDMIIHKMVAGRPRDIEDVRSILLKNPRFGRRYILKWLGEFNHSLGGESKKVFNRIAKEAMKK